MKKIKNFAVLFLAFVLSFGFCFNIACTSVLAHSNEIDTNDEWTITYDEDGNVVYCLDYTEEELHERIAKQIEAEYQTQASLARTNEVTYSVSYVSDVYDTGSSNTSYVLIGSYAGLGWAQRSSATFSGSLSFTISVTAKALLASATISMSISETITFNKNYDSKLGLFARLKTSKYKVTGTDNYTGNVVYTGYTYSLIVLAKTYRPIYANTDSTLFYVYGGSNYTAKTLKTTLSEAPKSSSDLVTATKTNIS